MEETSRSLFSEIFRLFERDSLSCKQKKRMKTIYTFLALILFCLSGYSQTALQRFLDNEALESASVGVQVTDLKTGRNIVSYNAKKSLTPASITKLITTATALETLGADYRFATRVATDAENPNRVLVLGSGDPTLGSWVFEKNRNSFFIQATESLKKELSPKEEYEIYVVDNLFGYDGISPEWTWIDIGNYYAAGSYGISIFDNTYKLFFNTTDKNAPPKLLRTEPSIPNLQFQNRLTLNTSGRDNGYIYGAPFSYERSVRGNIPAGRTEFSIKGDIPDPGMFLGETLRDYLSHAGFKIKKVETARSDYFASKENSRPIGKIVHTEISPPLSEIVREVNVTSNNHYAEHLIRTLGRNQNADIYSDALQEGIDFINRFWKEKRVSVSSLTLYDGSGLAPQNAFSPQFLTEILAYMHIKSSVSKAFFDSLPKAGKEGTVRSFLKGTKYDGKIVLKSGSIGGVLTYAGYLVSGNKKYAFTVMVNKFNGTRSQVKSAIETFLLSL